MRTVEVEIYPIEELEERAQERAHMDWLTSGAAFCWGDEVVDSLKAFCDLFPVKLKNYQLGSDRCDIHWEWDYYTPGWSMYGVRLWKYLNAVYATKIKNSCPFTGVCFDEDILDPLRKFLKRPDTETTFHNLIGDCIGAYEVAARKEFEYQESFEAFQGRSRG